jgi:hypothetical protein
MSDEYKLMRMCDDALDWEEITTGCIDTCKDYQTDDEAEYEYNSSKQLALSPVNIGNQSFCVVVDIFTTSSYSLPSRS